MVLALKVSTESLESLVFQGKLAYISDPSPHLNFVSLIKIFLDEEQIFYMWDIIFR